MSLTDMTAGELARAAGGRLLQGKAESKIRHISLDSRKMKGDDLFVPIIGETVDAHRFICQALEHGAAAVFTSEHHTPEDVKTCIIRQMGADISSGWKGKEAAWIEVEDTRKALQDVGFFCRKKRSLPLVGVTGSVGKTTTREMIAAALSTGFHVYKTPGNSNSQVGVPITIAEIPQDAQIGVIELGMSQPGEMTRIARIAQVDYAVITNIGVTHMENLGSRENILKEKLHIQDGMNPDGMLILNGDDERLRSVVPEGGRKALFYGMGENCQCRGQDFHLEHGYPVFTAVFKEESAQVRLKVMGAHMVSNALAALAVAAVNGISLKQAAAGLEKFEGFKGRQQTFKLGGITVIDDSYNASPASMKAGLRVLWAASDANRRIAVLADMKELGNGSFGFHREIGAYIAAHPVDEVLLLGELAAEIGRGLLEAGSEVPVTLCRDLEEVKGWLDKHLKEGDWVFFKGSNSMGLSEAVSYVKNQRSRQTI